MAKDKDLSKNLGGRPPFYNNPQELQEKALDYFVQIIEHNKKPDTPFRRPTITGLVLHLGFCDRKSFYAYEQREGFVHTIKNLRTQIENVYEEHLVGPNVSGIIFALKNLGWVDKSEVDSNVRYTKMPAIELDGEEMEFDV